MDMKKILEAMDGVKAKAEVNSSDMKKFLTIVEGKGPLNRPTTAESMAMQHYAEPVKKTITNPVLNVQEGATPSMIGKYFKTVEQELQEAASRPNKYATQLAKRVVERVVGGEEPTPPGINRLTGKPIEPEPNPTPTPPGLTLSSRYGPGYEGSPAAYTITVSGKDYKFAGRDKQGPGTGTIVKVPGGAVGIRGLAPVSVELGDDGMFYPAPTAPIQEAEGTPSGVAHLTKELLTHIVQQVGTEGAHAIIKSLTWGDGAAKELLHLLVNDLKDDIKGMDESVKQRLDPKCWTGKHKEGTKIKGGVRVNNCVPNEAVNPAQQAAIAIAKKKAGKK
jgi:hypothetical protein